MNQNVVPANENPCLHPACCINTDAFLLLQSVRPELSESENVQISDYFEHGDTGHLCQHLLHACGGQPLPLHETINREDLSSGFNMGVNRQNINLVVSGKNLSSFLTCFQTDKYLDQALLPPPQDSQDPGLITNQLSDTSSLSWLSGLSILSNNVKNVYLYPYFYVIVVI